MIVQKINKTRYHESVSPDRAVESGVLAMVDGVYIVLYCISNMPLPYAELMFRPTTVHTRSGPQCCDARVPYLRFCTILFIMPYVS